MKLNLGAGKERLRGYVSIDLDPNNEPDMVGDVRKLHWVVDESVEAIRAADVFEHLPYRDALPTLREWHRVLVPGGLLVLQVPAADVAIRQWVDNGGWLRGRLPGDVDWSRDPDWMGLVWRLMGGQDDGILDGQLNLHQNLFSEDYLGGLLDDACFDVRSWHVNEHPNYQVEAVKPV